jgi:hypothetical protein
VLIDFKTSIEPSSPLSNLLDVTLSCLGQIAATLADLPEVTSALDAAALGKVTRLAKSDSGQTLGASVFMEEENLCLQFVSIALTVWSQPPRRPCHS